MKNIKFIKSVYKLNQLPELKLPEVILCGRSNVGKSSFINSLFNRKNLAKTSSSPGKTRSINYYLVEEKFYIVDLPGFGYAKVPLKLKEEWQKLLKDFLNTSQNISIAIHLIDSRHNPTELDILLSEYLHESGIPHFVILNKIDKLKKSRWDMTYNSVQKVFPRLLRGENLFHYSALKKYGKNEIQQLLKNLFLK